jgi:hypothetical protein
VESKIKFKTTIIIADFKWLFLPASSLPILKKLENIDKNNFSKHSLDPAKQKNILAILVKNTIIEICQPLPPPKS